MVARTAISEDAETLLLGLCDATASDTDAIDAKLWADQIVELLDHHLIELQGTLSQAQIVATEAGQAYAKKLTSSGRI